MTVKHINRETVTIQNQDKFRGFRISEAEYKVSDVIDNAPTISAVSSVGCTAYVTFAHSPVTGGTAESFTISSNTGNISTTVYDTGKPAIVTGLATNQTYTFTVTANNKVSTKASAASTSITTTVSSVTANQSVTSMYALMTTLANSVTTTTPTAGGTLSVNGVSLGSYDYVIKRGDQSIGSPTTSTVGFTVGDWFTSTQDSRSALIVVDGNLTIERAVWLTPSVRKLFTCILVTGDLHLDGLISMTDRGANHSSSGSNISAGAIRWHIGTFSSVTDPNVPAAGGAGAARGSRTSAQGTGTVDNNTLGGTSGSNGGTGGGGAGSVTVAGGPSNVQSGGGSAGTSFSGGTGGGGIMVYQCDYSDAGTGGSNGGAGGVAGSLCTYGAAGGAGNPGGGSKEGSGSVTRHYDMGSGTAGTVCVFVLGTLKGRGKVESNGHDPVPFSYPHYMQSAGGAGGGGHVTVFYKYDEGHSRVEARGGSRSNAAGGGGAGTARKLAL